MLKALPVAGLVTEAADAAHDIEVAHGAGQQPGADSAEGYDSILGSPRRVPFVPEKPKQYDAFRDALEAHQRAQQPGWSVNAPSKSWPMTGAGGATAGVEGPEYPNLTGGVDQIGAQMQSGVGVAASAGAATGQAFQQGLMPQMQETLSAVQSIMQQILGAMDVSANPQIGGGVNSSSTPGRQSSLTPTDHGRVSAHDGAGWPLG